MKKMPVAMPQVIRQGWGEEAVVERGGGKREREKGKMDNGCEAAAVRGMRALGV